MGRRARECTRSRRGVHAAKGEKEQCRKELTATLDCASESTSDEAQFESLFDAGMILHDIGDWERCAPLLSTAAEAAEKLGKIAHAAPRGQPFGFNSCFALDVLRGEVLDS